MSKLFDQIFGDVEPTSPPQSWLDWKAREPAFLRGREYDPEDRWLWAVPLTPEEVAEFRAWMVSDPEIDAESFTCDDCSLNGKCILAFDFYNTDGDCLLEK